MKETFFAIVNKEDKITKILLNKKEADKAIEKNPDCFIKLVLVMFL